MTHRSQDSTVFSLDSDWIGWRIRWPSSTVGVFLLGFTFFAASGDAADAKIRVGLFDVDATPPVGAPLAYDPMTGATSRLRCRGVVLAGSEKPIVLCAVDWLGIGNESQRVFCERIARAAGTTPDRVAVHTLHQHDAPRCDFSAEALLAKHGHGGIGFDPVHARGVADAAATAVKKALDDAVEATHVGLGQADVKEVASNRRILGDDGKVRITRWTASKDPAVRALPIGTIDPMLKTILLFSGDKPVVALTYYACHPQSYYRTGLTSVDFPGLARNARQQATGTLHVHFNGAGGNIGAGKWNDGSKPNRKVLADKVADGMRRAFEQAASRKQAITADDLAWNTTPVRLPIAKHVDEAALLKLVTAKDTERLARYAAAKAIAWSRRCKSGAPIPIGCLTLGNARVLHMPGELFVEYQLAAQKKRPDLFVAMAAYGEYAPGYIGTKIAFTQGGYEASDRASRVTDEAESILMEAVAKLLK